MTLTRSALPANSTRQVPISVVHQRSGWTALTHWHEDVHVMCDRQEVIGRGNNISEIISAWDGHRDAPCTACESAGQVPA